MRPNWNKLRSKTRKTLCRQSFDVLHDQSDSKKKKMRILCEEDASFKSLVFGFLDSLGTNDGNQDLELRLSTFRCDCDDNEAAEKPNRTFENAYKVKGSRSHLLCISKDSEFQEVFYPGNDMRLLVH